MITRAPRNIPVTVKPQIPIDKVRQTDRQTDRPLRLTSPVKVATSTKAIHAYFTCMSTSLPPGCFLFPLWALRRRAVRINFDWVRICFAQQWQRYVAEELSMAIVAEQAEKRSLTQTDSWLRRFSQSEFKIKWAIWQDIWKKWLRRLWEWQGS